MVRYPLPLMGGGLCIHCMCELGHRQVSPLHVGCGQGIAGAAQEPSLESCGTMDQCLPLPSPSEANLKPRFKDIFEGSCDTNVQLCLLRLQFLSRVLQLIHMLLHCCWYTLSVSNCTEQR